MYNNLKIRVGALVLGVTLALAGSAFKPATTVYWYNVSEDGQMVGSYIGNSAPSCDEPSGDYCALGFLEEDIQNPSSSNPVLKSQVQADPLSYDDDERHKE